MITLRVLRSPAGRYFVAVVLVAGATVLTTLLPDEIERRNATLFFGAVMVSAWWGGLGTGLISTALSAAAIAWFFMPELHTFGLGHDDRIRMSLFIAIAGLISYLNGARQAAEERHAELLLREKIGRAKSESVEWRYTALADAAGVVSRARDARTAVERITHLAVPRFASGSAVHVRERSGAVTILAETRQAGALSGEDEMVAAAHVMDNGHPDLTPRLVVVPLTAGGRTLGAMAFVAAGERPYRDEDLAFAQDLAHHAALVLARVTVA